MNSVTIVLMNILQPAPMWLDYVQLIYMKFEDACITCNFIYLFSFSKSFFLVSYHIYAAVSFPGIFSFSSLRICSLFFFFLSPHDFSETSGSFFFFFFVVASLFVKRAFMLLCPPHAYEILVLDLLCRKKYNFFATQIGCEIIYDDD